jgi:hypothetical protein
MKRAFSRHKIDDFGCIFFVAFKRRFYILFRVYGFSAT